MFSVRINKDGHMAQKRQLKHICRNLLFVVIKFKKEKKISESWCSHRPMKRHSEHKTRFIVSGELEVKVCLGLFFFFLLFVFFLYFPLWSLFQFPRRVVPEW